MDRFCIFDIKQFEKTNFFNLVKDYKKKNKHMIEVVTRSKGVEYTPLKFNVQGKCSESHHRHHYQV